MKTKIGLKDILDFFSDRLLGIYYSIDLNN